MKTLENLLTDEFYEKIGFYSTAKGLYFALARSSYVDALAMSIQTGEVSCSDIRNFAGRLASNFHRGSRLPFEASLAAICVAIEEMPNDFSEEFLIDLASVKVSEIPFASRVAAICLANLFRLPKTIDTAVSCGDFDESSYGDSISFDYTGLSEFPLDAKMIEEAAECIA